MRRIIKSLCAEYCRYTRSELRDTDIREKAGEKLQSFGYEFWPDAGVVEYLAKPESGEDLDGWYPKNLYFRSKDDRAIILEYFGDLVVEKCVSYRKGNRQCGDIPQADGTTDCGDGSPSAPNPNYNIADAYSLEPATEDGGDSENNSGFDGSSSRRVSTGKERLRTSATSSRPQQVEPAINTGQSSYSPDNVKTRISRPSKPAEDLDWKEITNARERHRVQLIVNSRQLRAKKGFGHLGIKSEEPANSSGQALVTPVSDFSQDVEPSPATRGGPDITRASSLAGSSPNSTAIRPSAQKPDLEPSCASSSVPQKRVHDSPSFEGVTNKAPRFEELRLERESLLAAQDKKVGRLTALRNDLEEKRRVRWAAEALREQMEMKLNDKLKQKARELEEDANKMIQLHSLEDDEIEQVNSEIEQLEEAELEEYLRDQIAEEEDVIEVTGQATREAEVQCELETYGN
ncbi:hypothetical protein LTR37_010083 [Vermiconidia calcicola]|uniref:Uncharacterized protein n=1 Tax=Vermiconidia calcicola TaxID=1690605 RepID=A0ACC3N610_9PEZI|nr:hypothetical protein LTR37_010083 [Vermiconidia calcicola]